MSEFLILLNDPNLRSMAIPVIRETLGWAITSVRNRFSEAPEHLRLASDENLKKFTDLLVDNLLKRIEEQPKRDALVSANLSNPAGVSEVQRALRASTEIEDQFTRENLAALVAQTMTSKRESREKLTTRIAIDASKYLSESQLRLLAFMLAVMGTRPLVSATTQDEWTRIVIEWLQRYVARVVVDDPSETDVAILQAAGLVILMPGIVPSDLNREFAQGMLVPNLTEFFRTDPLGIRIESSYRVVSRVRLNLAGKLLAATTTQLISGAKTMILGLSE